MPELANPTELRQPALEPPVVAGQCEKIVRVLADERAGVRANEVYVVFGKPALDFSERMAVFFRMLILIAQPRLASRRFVIPITQHWIEWDQLIARYTRYEPAQPEWNACDCIVDP